MVVNLSRVSSRLFLTRHFLGFNLRCFTERYFSPVSSFSVLNISALHVQYGIQVLVKFKRPEYTRLHLRELQSQKFSRRSIRPKLPRKALRSQSWWVLLRPYYHCILLLVCTWRHGGHVGGQEQKLFSPLRTKLFFHVNSSRKYSFVLTPNMAALSRDKNISRPPLSQNRPSASACQIKYMFICSRERYIKIHKELRKWNQVKIDPRSCERNLRKRPEKI